MKKRIKAFLRKWIGFFLNPRLLLCVGLAWMVTNGWSYLFLLFGTLFSVPWMAWAGGAWLALLWFPFTPEKILTVALAILFLRLFFPRDTRTLGVLREELARIRSSLQNRRRKKGKKEDFTTHGVPLLSKCVFSPSRGYGHKPQ